MGVLDGFRFDFEISGNDFAAAGEASAEVKQALKKLAIDPEIIRRAAICMYEGEINMVLHADGGKASVIIDSDSITIVLRDNGKGIENIEEAMKEGFSTASQSVRSMGFGAGMGLPNMKKHSDEMTVESVPNSGTTVTMKIWF